MNEKENETTNSTTHVALNFCGIGIIGIAFWFVWTIAMGGWIFALICSIIFALFVLGIMLIGSEIGCSALLDGIILAVHRLSPCLRRPLRSDKNGYRVR